MPSSLKLLGCLALLLFFAVTASAQNTKGDRPVKNQRQVRETKSKSVRKKSKGTTRDLAGRRLRTRNKSSANRANASYQQSSPYSNKRKTGDRASAPRGRTFTNSPRESKRRAWTGDISGHRIRTKAPSRNDAARSNVYPQKGAYVNNPSRKPKNKPPKVYTRTASGKSVVRRPPSRAQRAWKGNIQGGPVGTRSATRSSDNVYSQDYKYSAFVRKSPKNKKDKPYRGAGGGLGMSSARRGGVGSASPQSATAPFMKRGKRNVYWGKYSKGERPFLKDLSGNPLRTRNFRSAPSGLVGRDTLRMFDRKPQGDRAYRGRKGGFLSITPFKERGWQGDLAGRKLRSPRAGRKGETAGSFVFPRKMSISGSGKAGRPIKGSGYLSRSGRRVSNRPLPARAPGMGASGIMRSMARTKGERPLRGGGSVGGSWNNKGRPLAGRSPGIGASGIMKNMARTRGERPLRGGGSISGSWNNKGRPLVGRTPGMGASGIMKNMARTKGQRPLRGGGSVSGGGWNNRNRPIDVRVPGSGTMRAGNFSGNIKALPQLKGGGSVSGRTWNNRNRAIAVRVPGRGTMRAGNFSGNIKALPQLKGGGSVSGRIWNNKEKPIDVRTPGSGTMRAGNFSGNIKAQRPMKGGGSVSGQTWNNKEKPIDVRTPGSGTMRAGNYSGNIKAHRPEKGGGSVSGQTWNNKEKPIEVRIPLGKNAAAVGYSGKKKIRKGYVQTPNAHEESTLKRRPHETTFMVDGLQVRVKQGKYSERPKAAEGSMPGIGPKDATIKASEYTGTVKLVRSYKHNPHSHKDALNGIGPTKESVRASEYSSSMKMYWRYKHAPLGAEEALKVRAPNKAYARIGDYQGNIKMNKFNDKRLHPDAQFAHKKRGNVKEDRTILMDVKLKWAKLFKKNDAQPTSVKDKPLKPRYDKSEKGLWADDPSYIKKKNEPKVE